MDFGVVLIQSLKLLKAKPKVFLPRLITTALYTLLIFLSAKTSFLLGVSMANASVSPNAELGGVFSDFTQQLIAILLFSVAVYAVDLVSYAMYPSIVADYMNGVEISLTRSFKTALYSWKTLVFFGVMVLAFVFSVSVLTGVLYALSLLTNQTYFMLIAVLMLLFSLLLFAMLFFFAIPVAVVERKGPLESLRQSVKLGLKHKKPVLKANVFFILLSTLTMIAATLSEFQGIIAYTAFAVFLLTRMFHAIVYTYMSVINPYLYLSIKEH